MHVSSVSRVGNGSRLPVTGYRLLVTGYHHPLSPCAIILNREEGRGAQVLSSHSQSCLKADSAYRTQPLPALKCHPCRHTTVSLPHSATSAAAAVLEPSVPPIPVFPFSCAWPAPAADLGFRLSSTSSSERSSLVLLTMPLRNLNPTPQRPPPMTPSLHDSMSPVTSTRGTSHVYQRLRVPSLHAERLHARYRIVSYPIRRGLHLLRP